MSNNRAGRVEREPSPQDLQAIEREWPLVEAGLAVVDAEAVLAVRLDTAGIGAGELAWQADAVCAQTDPEAFFPELGGSTRDAKRVCAGCPVRAECLAYALDHRERYGVWGGLSERERRVLQGQPGRAGGPGVAA